MMDLFFKPNSVAVIGASGTPGKLGYVIIKNIADSDFNGAVYPVNPKSDEILGYISISSYLDLATNQVGEVRNVGLVVKPEVRDGDSDRSIWMALRTTGTPTYASGKLTVKVGLLRG